MDKNNLVDFIHYFSLAFISVSIILTNYELFFNIFIVNSDIIPSIPSIPSIPENLNYIFNPKTFDVFSNTKNILLDVNFYKFMVDWFSWSDHINTNFTDTLIQKKFSPFDEIVKRDIFNIVNSLKNKVSYEEFKNLNIGSDSLELLTEFIKKNLIAHSK